MKIGRHASDDAEDQSSDHASQDVAQSTEHDHDHGDHRVLKPHKGGHDIHGAQQNACCSGKKRPKAETQTLHQCGVDAQESGPR